MTRHAITVRHARLSDAGELARIDVRSWREAYADVFPRSELEKISVRKRLIRFVQSASDHRPDNALLVAEIDGRLAAYARIGPARDEDVDGAGEIHAFYVDPRLWRKGVGTRLIGVAQMWLARRFDRVMLWVIDENERARCFYEQHGFTLDEGLRCTYPFFDARAHCVRYSRDLEATARELLASFEIA